MGLASKLRESPPYGGNQKSVHPPQGGYPPQQGYPPQNPGYPPQGGYPQQGAGYQPQGGYPGAPGYGGGYPPPGPGGPYSNQNMPPHQQQMGRYDESQDHVVVQQGQQHPPGTLGHIRMRLEKCVAENQLQTFYNPQRLEQLAQQVASLRPQLDNLIREWGLSNSIADDLQKLALYDIVILCDDSGSMAHEENGERIEDLQKIVGYVGRIAAIYDLDGILVRFLNSNPPVELTDGIRDVNSANRLIASVRFAGMTPLGTALEEKVLKPFIYNRSHDFTKPLLVICVTDGNPAGESPTKLFEVIKQSSRIRNDFGRGAVAFSFAQVGTDLAAQDFLQQLDSHPEIGSMVDVTSNYEFEAAQLKKKGLNLTPQIWIAKLMLGPIDRAYDSMDE